MSYHEGLHRQELGRLVRLKPDTAKAKILAAYRKSGGYVPAAAAILGVGARSLVRWTTDLRLRSEVDKIRINNGKEDARSRRPSTSYNPAGVK